MYGTLTLKGKHTTGGPNGKPHAGQVVVEPNTVIRDTEGDVVMSGKERVTLAADGSWSIVLPCDSPELNPSSGIGYTVGFSLRATSLKSVSFYATADLAGKTLDVSDIVSVSIPAPLSAIVGPPAPDATTETAGKVRLAGDLAGTADAPTVPGLAAKVDTTDPRLSDARPPLAHTHPTAQVTGLDQALGQKVDNADPRLSDARTPLPHTHAPSQVDGLEDALASKVSTDDPRLAGPLLQIDTDGVPYFA